MSFALDVSKFVEKAKKNPETVMRAVSMRLFSDIIYESPVDTGRFKLNWQAAGPTPRSGTLSGVDPTGKAAVASMETYIKNSAQWSEFTLTNNLPYAAVIEFGGYPGSGPNTVGGYSKQAPNGVVRVNIARIESLLNQETAKVR